MNEVQVIRQHARERLGQAAQIVDDLVATGAVNLDWYLREKIVKPDHETYLDHRRALKYARLFGLGSALVTFLIEGRQPTPDLQVELGEWTFFVEVKKFRFVLGATGNPILKIATNVEAKIRQLAAGNLSFVAIDSFDLNLESDDEDGGLTHGNIEDAFRLMRSRARETPEVYGPLSAVIFAANTTGGALSGPIGENAGIPTLLWPNPAASAPVPDALRLWILETLPGGISLDDWWLGHG